MRKVSVCGGSEFVNGARLLDDFHILGWFGSENVLSVTGHTVAAVHRQRSEMDIL